VFVDGAMHWIPERFECRSIEGGDVPIVDVALVSSELQLELWVETFVDITLGIVVRAFRSRTTPSGSAT